MTTTPVTAPSRLPRRFLLGGSIAAAVTGAEMLTAPAEAAAATAPWVLGGNTAVTATNYLGVKNVAALIFKTSAVTNTPLERMRILATGQVGIGTTTPTTTLDVVATTGSAIRGTANTTSASAIGVRGAVKNGVGVQGQASGSGTGVVATATSGNGVSASSTDGVAVLAESTNNYGLIARGGGSGIYASATTFGGEFTAEVGVRANGNTTGVTSFSSSGTGVSANTASGTGLAATSSSGDGVNASGGNFGVRANGGQAGVYATGTRGVEAVSGSYIGVLGTGPTFAVAANLTSTTGTNYAIFGDSRPATGGTNYAGGFAGNVAVFGTLSKSAGSFRIDHPLDPDHQWLSHSFVESPDMMNVYNGNVVLDASGEATVRLPSYFTALNRDYRYQLTCIGQHAPVYVAAKVANNAFHIAGGSAGLEVSWMVTGIRQDAYAKAHPIVTEEAKSTDDRGTRAFVPPGVTARQTAPRVKQTKPPSA